MADMLVVTTTVRGCSTGFTHDRPRVPLRLVLVEGAACLHDGLVRADPNAMMPYSAFTPAAGPGGPLLYHISVHSCYSLSHLVTDHEEMLEGMPILEQEAGG